MLTKCTQYLKPSRRRLASDDLGTHSRFVESDKKLKMCRN